MNNTSRFLILIEEVNKIKVKFTPFQVEILQQSLKVARTNWLTPDEIKVAILELEDSVDHISHPLRRTSVEDKAYQLRSLLASR